MKYNYILSTGQSIITGGAFQLAERNAIANIGEEHVVNFGVISGRNISQISLNSQTLLEGVPEIYTGTNQIVYEVTSGDYYFDVERANNYGKVFLDADLIVRNTNIMLYDKISLYTGLATALTGQTYVSGYGQIAAQAALRGETVGVDMFTGWSFFLNGQKISSYNALTGEVPVGITGKLFAIKKPPATFEFNSGASDSYGRSFVPYQVDFYVNGMEQKPDLFVQTYTGVNTIVTGVQGSTVLFSPESNSYSL